MRRWNPILAWEMSIWRLCKIYPKIQELLPIKSPMKIRKHHKARRVVNRIGKLLFRQG